jgi:hypothetical protein
MHHTVLTPGTIEVSICDRGVVPDEQPKCLDWKTESFSMLGKPIRFVTFIAEQVDKMVATEKVKNGAKYRLEGEHAGQRAVAIEFDPGEFEHGGVDVERMVLVMRFTVSVRKKKMLSRFEIKDQGRIFSFEPIDDVLPGKQLKIDIVQKL